MRAFGQCGRNDTDCRKSLTQAACVRLARDRFAYPFESPCYDRRVTSRVPAAAAIALCILAISHASSAEPATAERSAGDWVFTSIAGAAVGKSQFGDRRGEVYSGRLGIGYHLTPRVALNLEVMAAGLYMECSSCEYPTAAGGFDLLLRVYLLRLGRFDPYFEGGVGAIWSSERYPPGGTSQNFTLELGVGTSIDLSRRVKGLTGIRWFHISNAARDGKNRNPAFNSAMFYLGLLIPL